MDETRTLNQIVDHYRELASEAERMAAGTLLPPKYRDAYRKMARHWIELAEEIEECLEEDAVSLN
ncbi:MAG: hypothetical protein ABSD74_01740 [Rhizomicrobium sp.]|jgi:hypothetical protein